MKSFAVILVAAGQSSRFSTKRTGLGCPLSDKKPFALLKGRAVWLHAAQKFANRPDVKQTILVVPPEDIEEIENRFTADLSFMSVTVVAGGKERYQSVQNALKHLAAGIEFVAVHDAVRPCLTDALIENVFDAAVKYGAAIPASPVVDTLKGATTEEVIKTEDKTELAKLQAEFGLSSSQSDPSATRYAIEKTVDRSKLWEAQTPQTFRRDWLLEAYAKPPKNVTDDSQLVEQLGKKVVIVPSDRMNLKITTRIDLMLAEKILDIQSRKTRPVFDNF
ncbi:MAG: IspD/TarI family cytidylyltransferase [Planctomycetia bacterium]|nr:IspD/TarI family cytidylyltransferase [Planctomycetia bacterium]